MMICWKNHLTYQLPFFTLSEPS